MDHLLMYFLEYEKMNRKNIRNHVESSLHYSVDGFTLYFDSSKNNKFPQHIKYFVCFYDIFFLI